MIPAFILKTLMLKIVFNIRSYPHIVQVIIISLANFLVSRKQIKKIQEYFYLVKSLMPRHTFIRDNWLKLQLLIIQITIFFISSGTNIENVIFVACWRNFSPYNFQNSFLPSFHCFHFLGLFCPLLCMLQTNHNGIWLRLRCN